MRAITARSAAISARRRIGALASVAACADRADRRRGPRARECRASGGRRPAIPRPAASVCTASSRKAQLWATRSISPSRRAVTPWLVIAPRSTRARPCGERQRNVELVERRSAEPHVAPDVDRPAPAAAQRLLQVDAEDRAVRRLERRCSGRGSRSPRRAKRRRPRRRSCAPPRPVVERAGRNWRIAAPRSASASSARCAHLEVAPDADDGGFALEAAAIGRGRRSELTVELAVRDDHRCGGVSERAGRRRRDGPRTDASRDRRPRGGANAKGFALQPPDGSKSRRGGPRSGSSASVSAASVPETAGRPPASSIASAPSRVCPALVSRRLAERQPVRLGLDLARDREVVGGQNGRRLGVEESRQGGDRRDGRGQIAVGAGFVPERDRAAERELDQGRIEPEGKRAPGPSPPLPDRRARR